MRTDKPITKKTKSAVRKGKPTCLSIIDVDSNLVRKVQFDPPPEVLFQRLDPGETSILIITDDTPLLTACPSDGSMSAVWLFFRHHVLSAAVKCDALPVDMDSYEKCKTNWPRQILAHKHGTILRGDLPDGRELLGRHNFCLAEFDPALAGTAEFWDNLELVSAAFEFEEIKTIKTIAKRRLLLSDSYDGGSDNSLTTFLKSTAGVSGEPTADDILIKEVARKRVLNPPHTPTTMILYEIAKHNISVARKDPNSCRWLRPQAAFAFHRLYVGGETPGRAIIKRHACTLERRLNRALERYKHAELSEQSGQSSDK